MLQAFIEAARELGYGYGLVARGLSRLVTIASGLDPHGLGVPEVFWMRRSGDYRAAARGFESGTRDGLAAWLVLSCQALRAGARARRPLARTPVTKRADRVRVGGLGVQAMRYGCNPTQGAVVVVRSSQLRRPATLLPIPRL